MQGRGSKRLNLEAWSSLLLSVGAVVTDANILAVISRTMARLARADIGDGRQGNVGQQRHGRHNAAWWAMHRRLCPVGRAFVRHHVDNGTNGDAVSGDHIYNGIIILIYSTCQLIIFNYFGRFHS